MYAILRENSFDADKLPNRSESLDEFQKVHAAQAGYRGSITIDAGAGRWLVVNLWEDREHASAALPKMVPVVKRLLEPMMTAPSKLLGEGAVVAFDVPSP